MSNFLNLAKYQAEWADKTFGPSRDALGPLRHLGKEVSETIEAIRNGEPSVEIEMEFADLLILILDASRRWGLSPEELVKAAHLKMRINESRTWPKLEDQVPGQPVEHVKDDQ